MKKTYKFNQVPLSKEDRFLFDRLYAQCQVTKIQFDRYLLDFLLPVINLSKEKGFVQYDLQKGEFTYEEHQQPQPKNKPGEGGDTKVPAGGDVQRQSESNG